MLFTEIALQNVVGFPKAARIPLAPGINTFVTKEASLFSLLQALFDMEASGAALGGLATPRRLALTLTGDDGQSYRLIRDLDGGRTLLRSDPGSPQPVRISDDPAGVSEALRELLGLPGTATLSDQAWLTSAQLPSHATGISRPASPAGPASMAASRIPSLAAPSLAHSIAPSMAASMAPSLSPALAPADARRKLPQLQAELERAELLERMQDEIHELRQRQDAFSQESAALTELQRRIDQTTRELDVIAQTTQGLVGLEARVKKLPDLRAKHESAARARAQKRSEYEQEIPAHSPLMLLVRDPIVLGGAIAGVACIIAAIAIGSSWPLALDLLPFGVAAFGGWRWVDKVEGGEHARRHLVDLIEHEKKAKRQFDAETVPVETAMKAAGVKSIEEIVSRFDAQADWEAQRHALQTELELRRADPQLVAAEEESRTIESELKAREQSVNEIGFSRGSGEIRGEIELAEQAASGNGPADPLTTALTAAAELAGARPERLLEGFTDRLGQYVAALTDRRCTGLRLVEGGGLRVLTANGPVALTQLTPGDQNLVYVALRIGLAERVSSVVKRPFIVDEPSTLVDAAHRPLFVKMLKGLGSLTQVIVRALEPPAISAADHVAVPAPPRA